MLTKDNIIDMIKSHHSKVELAENDSVIKIYSKNLVTELRPNSDIDEAEFVEYEVRRYEVRREGSLLIGGCVYNMSWDTLLDMVYDSNQENTKNLIFSEYGIE